jgi:hypothetical protein
MQYHRPRGFGATKRTRPGGHPLGHILRRCGTGYAEDVECVAGVARQAFAPIAVDCNQLRTHSALGDLSPAAYDPSSATANAEAP